ncbi:hypothetical protein [Cereibacter johrii]|uniref:hypothetical protein n=1 Tax=Cereibacter johrii TaxID=445629 RepID=UPI003CEBC4D5
MTRDEATALRAALLTIKALPVGATHPPEVSDLRPRLLALGLVEAKDYPEGRRYHMTDAGMVATAP